jgi:ATP-dependent DNA ligase
LAEGLMLKRRDSIYEPGRPKGRIRWDKPAREADELSTLEKMLD